LKKPKDATIQITSETICVSEHVLEPVTACVTPGEVMGGGEPVGQVGRCRLRRERPTGSALGQPRAQQLLALVGAFAAVGLGFAEEFG